MVLRNTGGKVLDTDTSSAVIRDLTLRSIEGPRVAPRAQLAS